jgi:4-hydroxy-3-polyprenylbenzoate decarboxylase
MKMTMIPEIMDMDMPVEGVFHNLVIAQINKEYAGQGQKVMNAMWGAGQMMFNKILVIGDQHIRIQDYRSLAKYVFKSLNPATDIYFSQGPMDVLDHSCSKLGFGGKMCIDGSGKFEEERDDQFEIPLGSVHLPDLPGLFPEVKKVNTRLLEEEIPVLIVSVQKDRKDHVRQLHHQLCELKEIEGVKVIMYVEHNVDANDLGLALWRFCNNLDPKRDYSLVTRPSLKYEQKMFACMGLDGTRKTRDLDNFKRDWPNIIVADDETIRKVDEKWSVFGLGEFLPSPSLKYKDQMYGSEAVVS